MFTDIDEEAARPDSVRFRLSARHRIVAGAAVFAALAGAGIAALDYPWRIGDGRRVQVNARFAAESPPVSPPAPPSLAPVALASPPLPAPVTAKAAARPARKPPPVRRRVGRAVAAAEVPAARRMPTLDGRYERDVGEDCAAGLKGFFCREAVRWRLCQGRWNDADPGATHCYVGKKESVFPSAG